MFLFCVHSNIWVVLCSILPAYNGSTCLSACSHFSLAIHLRLVQEPFFLFLFAEDQESFSITCKLCLWLMTPLCCLQPLQGFCQGIKSSTNPVVMAKLIKNFDSLMSIKSTWVFPIDYCSKDLLQSYSYLAIHLFLSPIIMVLILKHYFEFHHDVIENMHGFKLVLHCL